MNKVLITGVTGFLASHIVEVLLDSGNEVVALKRSTSHTWRCRGFLDVIEWINIDDVDWKGQVIKQKVDVIIHSAWSGVAANNRLQWKEQLVNLDLLLDLLELAAELNVSKFIGLGSQAEYGTFSGKIDEAYPTSPNTAYGAVKLMALELTKSFCEANRIKWFWLRLFPIFGEKEDTNWLIPSVIRNIFDKKAMNLTPGLQRYAYLYVRDFAKHVLAVVDKDAATAISGIYNVSSTEAITLKNMVEKIRDRVDHTVQLNFGALAYRPYQSMHMEGEMLKFHTNFEKIENQGFEEMLDQTIDYYINKYLADGQ